MVFKRWGRRVVHIEKRLRNFEFIEVFLLKGFCGGSLRDRVEVGEGVIVRGAY